MVSLVLKTMTLRHIRQLNLSLMLRSLSKEETVIAGPADPNKVTSSKDYGGVDDVKGIRRALLTPPTPSIEPVLVTEEMAMDYVTLRGIENKLGVKKEDIPTYVLHELLDNALDYIEAAPVETKPEINVKITSGSVIHVKVSNSDTGQSLTNEIILNTFNYHNYSSTKRNQFKVGRGALGHGLKTVLGSLFALATEHFGYSGWIPLKIRNGNNQWTINLTVDKITGLYPPDIESTVINDNLMTEVEIDIPMRPVHGDSVNKNRIELIEIFKKYLILNPHITMNLTVDNKHYHYPQVQKIKPGWKNLHTIWSYSKKDFEYLISTIKNKNRTLYEVIQSTGISEAYFLKKRREFNISLTLPNM